MAVEIKYVVVRKGDEKMTFASKKEADAYDKMLDMAEVFSDWLCAAPLTIDEEQREALGLFLAENKDVLQHILRTSRQPELTAHPAEESEAETVEESQPLSDAEEHSETGQEVARPAKKLRANKAA
ncbi:YebG family protein [Erwinia psidii]|uniref:DNA damage-inducible SOS regulon protein n=1 Tax=Erwinia psidii TaxID=69224 RepID=A0A3N6V2A7_9GAMM|nr:YebG family protein [Erwinia psidii]MCX8956213.1 hypothetical protein [Erwinia psidii]MCX8960027.1 hypothetical protein [Erwinia psidii]MCX8963572.1 hypothetical protein [Erwinia psidii]RQM39215.1 hypothetical protein EB241_05530 [Erwinia psidii]